MDSRIESLKSTTFCGRRLTRCQIADVQETVALSPALSRNELAKTVCEHLNWTTPKGGYRVAACMRMLEPAPPSGPRRLPVAYPGGPLPPSAAVLPVPAGHGDTGGPQPVGRHQRAGRCARPSRRAGTRRHRGLRAGILLVRTPINPTSATGGSRRC